MEEDNGFLKQVCYKEKSGYTIYKCLNSEEFYFHDPDYYLAKHFQGNVCPGDPSFYQACDNRLNSQITNNNLLCGNYLCYKGFTFIDTTQELFNRCKVTCHNTDLNKVGCLERNITLPSGEVVSPGEVCNGECEVSRCEDEGECGGVRYGVYCRARYDREVWYVPPWFICDRVRFCLEGEDEKGCEVKEGEVKEGEVKEGEVKEGEVKEGEVKEGEVKEGEVKEGEVKEGEVKEGEVKEGEVKESEVKEGEVKEGEVKEGEVKEGEVKEGEVKEGEVKEGEVKEGEVKEGEVKEGEVKEGEVKEGEVKESEVKEGEVKEGEVKEGEVKEGEVKEGEVKEGEVKEGEVKEGEVKEGEVKEGEVKEGEVKEGEVKEGEVKEGEVKEGEVKEGEVKEGEVKEGEVKEGEVRVDTLTYCRHARWGYKVPVFNYTRCTPIKRENYFVTYQPMVYCQFDDVVQSQTNCSDVSRVGVRCEINGYLSTVSKHLICFDGNISACDDSIDSRCLTTKSCRIHKHLMCDGEVDCDDRADETHTVCSSTTKRTCTRRVGERGDLPIPLSWLRDGVSDCEDGIDETGDWPTCGRGKTSRYVSDRDSK